jgi:ketosteroid isomerase-like protein
MGTPNSMAMRSKKMSSETKDTTLDAVTWRIAIEASDARTIIDLYADDAELQVMDKLHRPSAPQVFRGKDGTTFAAETDMIPVSFVREIAE